MFKNSILLIIGLALSYDFSFATIAYYVSPSGKGTESGISPNNAAVYTDEDFWPVVEAALTNDEVIVYFLDGTYNSVSQWVTLDLGGVNKKRLYLRSLNHDMVTVKSQFFFNRLQNASIQNLNWKDFTLDGYGLMLRSTYSPLPCCNILVENCVFSNLAGGSAFGNSAVGTRDFTYYITYKNCLFEDIGTDGGDHCSYNALNPTHIVFDECVFDTCSSSVVRFRSADFGRISNCTFDAPGQVAIESICFNQDESSPWEYLYPNLDISNCSFNCSTALLYRHNGYSPPEWDYLLTSAEGAVLQGTNTAAKTQLLLNNFGIDAANTIYMSNTNNTYSVTDEAILGTYPKYGASAEFSGAGEIWSTINKTIPTKLWDNNFLFGLYHMQNSVADDNSSGRTSNNLVLGTGTATPSFSANSGPWGSGDYSLLFDGDDASKISNGWNPLNNGWDRTLSVELAIKLTSLPTSDYYVHIMNINNKARLRISCLGWMQFSVLEGGVWKYTNSQYQVTADGNWHRVFAYSDGHEISLEVDGVGRTPVEGVGFIPSGTSDIIIGASDISGTSGVKAYIDEVRIGRMNSTPMWDNFLCSGYYHMESVDGNAIADDNSSGRHPKPLILADSPRDPSLTTVGNGCEGGWSRALYFDGSDVAYITSGYTPDANDYTRTLRVDTYFKVESRPTQAQYSAAIFNIGGYRASVMLLYTGKIRFRIYDSAYYQVDTVNAVTNNQWHHLVAEADGSTLKITVDGETASTACAHLLPAGDAAVFVGAYHNGSTLSGPFKGWIDEFVYENIAH